MKKIYTILLTALSVASYNTANAQVYHAPQDTSKIKRAPGESLTNYSTTTQLVKSDSRLLGAAVKAATVLKDTTKYDNKKGIPLTQLFSDDDLKYIARQGVSGAVALFDLVNQNLPKGEAITFKTDSNETVVTGDNPLVLKNLRAIIASKPATVGEPQWKENIYQAYAARDYGTKLFNTITITSATTEIRENPNLEILDFDGQPITLAKISSRNKTEAAAVLDFRMHTFPNGKISEANANENYKRALFELIRLQENDINQHPESKQLVTDLAADLQKGDASNTINALKTSNFFEVNVPGSDGPVLLTESDVINASAIAANAPTKAMEITVLASLHYGERDAVKLLSQLVKGNGAQSAQQTGFTPKRLNELTGHGVEKFKSLGFQKNKTFNMTNADLVLVAVSSPDIPAQIKPDANLGIITQQAVGASIVNSYSSVEETTIVNNHFIFNPHISLNSRHTLYRTENDPIGFVPNADAARAAKISQNGAELRLESDIYFGGLKSINNRGVKPVIYPEFGVLYGIGNRSVGYDNNTIAGVYGPVPQFQSRYTNWGSHLGLNVGPIMVGIDGTILTTPVASDPDSRFFDLSQGMTYFRYEFLAHVFYWKLKHDMNFTVDLELVGETNNEGFGNLASTQAGDAQIFSSQWYRDYNLTHPGGVLNQALATSLLDNGDVKASYPSDNYGTINLGLQKANFKLSADVGLFNVNGKQGYQIYDNLVRNLFKGDLGGSVGLTYYLGSKSFTSKHTKKDSYSSSDPTHHVQETSSDDNSHITGPRDHYIFVK
jgi:hypothetical protein